MHWHPAHVVLTVHRSFFTEALLKPFSAPDLALTQRRSWLSLAAGTLLAATGAGSSTWAQAAALCRTGKRQSPIDITQWQPGPARPLALHYQPAPLKWVHDGHTIRIRLAGTGSQASLGTERLALQQTHFHLPGGDMLRGESFPMAMHWIHKSASGQLVTLVVWFRQGGPHPGLTELLAHLPQEGQPEHTVPGLRFDPNAWWPADRAYFTYEGSLTSEPCTEGVRWVLLQTPLTASAEQLIILRQHIAPNARPVQPLNGRRVLAHG